MCETRKASLRPGLYISPGVSFSSNQPSEPTYALLTGNPLLPHHLKSLNDSRVIHVSRDPSVAATQALRDDGEEGAPVVATASTTAEAEMETDPDRVITNARRAKPEDGLLTDEEIIKLFDSGGKSKLKLRSGYDEALAGVPEERDNVYGARDPSATITSYGANEPMYTSFTHFWQLTLDYIFIADPVDANEDRHLEDKRVKVVGVLPGHRKKDMGDGLPKLGVCGSDHVALMVEVAVAHSESSTKL